MSIRISATILCVLGFVAWAIEAVPAQSTPAPSVLVVFSRSEDFPGNILADSGLRDVFRRESDLDIDYHSEYLESDRFPDVAEQSLRDYIQAKYGDRRITVVMAVTDAALNFVLQNRDSLFPGAAIVASGTTSLNSRGPRPFLTGVSIDIDYRETLALIQTLHPTAEALYVIARAPNPGVAARVQQQLGALSPRLPVSFINEDSMERLAAAVKAVPPKGVILFVADTQLAHGQPLYPAQIASTITGNAAVPVYAVNDAVMGTGVVGGIMNSTPALVTRLGQMTLQILKGASPDAIPIESVAHVPIFDWRQLQRWRIAPSLLPAGADIRYRVPSTWEQYGGYIVAAALLLLIQAATIGALVVQRSRSRESEARSEAILHAIPDLMFLMTRDGTYRDFHAADQTQLLLRPEQFIGKRLRDVMPPHIAELFETCLAKLTPQQVEIAEYALELPDGERQFEARLTLTRGGDVLAIARDVTAPKRADALLLETQTELNRVSRLTAIGEFSASLAHEVRQPLTAILMNARACLRMLPPPIGPDSEVRQGLLDIVDASQRAEELVRRNQELFRHHTVQTVPLNINSVIVEALSMTAANLREAEVEVRTSLPRTLPPVSGDRIELEQVLLNLLTNAIDAMRPLDAAGRQIDVASRLGDEGFVEISVSDRGVGLGDVDMSRMFELSYTTKASGSGVGLSVSRAIVLAHGGRIWAEPGSNGGARFAFTVPIARRTAEFSSPGQA